MADLLKRIDRIKIRGFCSAWKISEFAVFGSVLRDDFTAKSDIDILVSFSDDAAWSLLDHVTMRDELEHIMGREVDLVTRKGVEQSRNSLRRNEILKSAVVVYAEP